MQNSECRMQNQEPQRRQFCIHDDHRSATPLARPPRPHARPDAGAAVDDRHHPPRVRALRIRSAEHAGDRVPRRPFRQRRTGDAAVDLPRHESGERGARTALRSHRPAGARHRAVQAICRGRSGAIRSRRSGAPTSRTRAATASSRSSISTRSAPSRRSRTPRSSPGCATRCPRSTSAAISSASRAAPILNLLLDFAGISKEQGADVFRVLDKLDKVGIEKVRLELMQGYKDESGDTIRGLGLSRDQVDASSSSWRSKPNAARGRRSTARALFASVTGADAQIDAVARISESPLLRSATATIASRSISRSRADSRTTPVRSSRRSCSTRRSSARSSAAAATTTSSCAFSARRFPRSAHRSASIASSPPSRTSAPSASRRRRRACSSRTWIRRSTDDYLQMTWELRRAGIPTELYIGTAKGPGKQLKYADQYEIPIVSSSTARTKSSRASSRSRT